ncbi:MAG: hypothetical protein ACLFUJ_14070 [Phycisphaerae bacterium]
MIEFKCSNCGKQLRVKDDAAGKKGKCPQCGTELTVPDAELVELQDADRPAAPPPPPPTHANPHSKPVPPSRPSVTVRKHRRWVIVLLVAAVIAIPFAPKFPLWLGIVLLGLCAVAFVPKVSAASRWLLRLPQDRRWASGLRVTMYALIGLVLVLGGVGGAQFKAEQDRIAAEQAAKEAEQRRLTAEANETVASLAREAEEHWKSGQAALAEDKLHQAERTQHATNLAPVKQLRTRMANAQVDAVMQEAVDAVKNADLTLAQKKVQEAMAIPNATALDEPRQLQGHIANATDPDHIKKALMDLSDEAFKAFQESATLPTALASGYDTLDGQALTLAQANADGVAAAREKRRQERIAQERAAAEAAQKAEEERKARELAAAEAKRKEERKERIESGFSAWDGSHRGLTKVIKASMNDPKSYDHVETVYWDQGDHLIVRTTFRGKNAFGGVVANWVKAKVDLDGNVLAIIEQGP